MSNDIYDILILGLRSLYILSAPLILVVFVAGSLASILQSALSVQEETMNYAAKLIAFVLLMYLVVPSAAQQLLVLAERALH
jgi:type III secretory pathway component EscS